MFTFLRQYGFLQSNNFDITTCPALTGKTAVITGGNDGIGGEIVKHLLLNDISQVIVLARSSTKYQNTYTNVWVPALAANPERIDRVRFIACDLADLAAVDRVGKEILSTLTRLDFLFLNAGVAFDVDYRLVNGVETTFAINHLGHFHLTQILTPLLISSMPSRVIVTSSSTHMIVPKKFPIPQVESPTPTSTKGPAWDSMYRYGRSKLANILFTRALVKRLPEGVVANSFNPGSIATEAAEGWKNLIGEFGGRVMMGLLRMLGQTVTQAAATAIYMAVGDAEEVGRGNYFVPIGRMEKTSALAEDAEWAEELWDWSVEKVDKILGELEGTKKSGNGNRNVPNELLAHPVCLPPA